MKPSIGPISLPAGGYALQAGASQTNPADATTYYFGAHFGNAYDTGAGTKRVYVPRAGLITKVFLQFSNGVGNGTTETSSVSLRLNNTTDYLISNAVDNSNTFVAQKADLSIPVAQGDYFEFKWVTPTWVTNPQGTRPLVVVWVEV